MCTHNGFTHDTGSSYLSPGLEAGYGAMRKAWFYRQMESRHKDGLLVYEAFKLECRKRVSLKAVPLTETLINFFVSAAVWFSHWRFFTSTCEYTRKELLICQIVILNMSTGTVIRINFFLSRDTRFCGRMISTTGSRAFCIVGMYVSLQVLV